MKTLKIKLSILFLAVTYSLNSQSALIHVDLLDVLSKEILDYSNPSATSFSDNNDAFNIYNQYSSSFIPQSFLDTTLSNAGDQLGIIKQTNADNFFAITDTINPNNTSSLVRASWEIDITNLSSLQFMIDMAAMGDFENNDIFSWQYSIDGNISQNLFSSVTNNSLSQKYILESGKTINLNDPLSVNNQILSNQFQRFSHNFNNTGKKLTIELSSRTNGSNEIIAFQNIGLFANSHTLISVSEPKTYMLLFISLILLLKIRIK